MRTITVGYLIPSPSIIIIAADNTCMHCTDCVIFYAVDCRSFERYIPIIFMVCLLMLFLLLCYLSCISGDQPDNTLVAIIVSSVVGAIVLVACCVGCCVCLWKGRYVISICSQPWQYKYNYVSVAGHDCEGFEIFP